MKMYRKEKMLFMHVYAVSSILKCLNGKVLQRKNVIHACLCRFMQAQMYEF